MSVLLPWDRKRPSKEKDAREVRTPDSWRPRPGRQPGARGFPAFGPPAWRLLLLGALSALAVAAITSGLRTLPARFETAWEARGSRLVSAYSGRYLLSGDNGLSVWDGSGKLLDAGMVPGEAILGGDAIFVLIPDPGWVARQDIPAGPAPGGIAGRTVLATVSPGETMLAYLEAGILLTAKPGEGLTFGEPWLLRAVADNGSALWEQSLPGVPLVLNRGGARIAAGVVDLSSGGIPVLAVLDAKTGKVAWTRNLHAGLWRGLGFSADGTVIAVLDTGIRAFEPDGSIAWVLDQPAPIIAAEVTADATFLSTRGPGGITKLFSPYVIKSVSASGTSLWTRSLRERPRSLSAWEARPAQNSRPDALVALSDVHVIGFSVRDGERLFAKRTGSRPVSLRGDRLLLESGQGLRLVEFWPAELSGKALTP